MISDRWMILSFQSLVLMFHNNGKDVSEIPMVSSWFPRSYRNLCASAPLRPPSFVPVPYPRTSATRRVGVLFCSPKQTKFGNFSLEHVLIHTKGR